MLQNIYNNMKWDAKAEQEDRKKCSENNTIYITVGARLKWFCDFLFNNKTIVRHLMDNGGLVDCLRITKNQRIKP